MRRMNSVETRRMRRRGPACTVAIVGGGASGALLAIQLLRRASDPLKIVFIEPRANLGGGIAYSTPFTRHLLNVVAGQMSALPDQPDHFVRWLRKNTSLGYGPESFVRRSLYGDYLADTLYEHEGLAPRRLATDHYRTRATRLEVSEETVRVWLSDDIGIVADRVVLALGHHSAASRFASNDVPTFSAWSGAALDDLDPALPVLLVGTGLTAVDTALALDELAHRGAIHAVSRHGKWPQVHSVRSRQKASSAVRPEGVSTARGLLRFVRGLVQQGHDGPSIVDLLRANSPSIWANWSLEERSRFLRHLRIYWEVRRHRMPLEVARKIDEMRWNGRLVLHTGRIKKASSVPGGSIAVRIARRGGHDECDLKVSRIIDCSGPESDYRRWSDPLIVQLLQSGLAKVDPLSLGLLTDDLGALIDESGVSSQVLFTIGPARRATLWESTAISEIRRQAASLASHLIGDLLPKPAAHGQQPVATRVQGKELSNAHV